MRRVSGRRQAQSATSSISPRTNGDITVHFPPESGVRASVFSEGFACVESRFDHFRTIIHDPSARVAAISAIDKEIDDQLKAVDEHHRAVNAARKFFRSQLARRNALTPILVLPPEVLTTIFHFLVFEDPACSAEQNLGWIRTTHVCRFWRQVALNDSSLWATISGISANATLISEMLARARNAPLNIDIHLDGASGQEVLSVCLPHLSHSRKFSLFSRNTLRYGNVKNICYRGICCREAPALEHFELGSSGTFPIPFQGLDGTSLFKGQAPRLRTFSLSHVVIPWSHIPRGQLTQLKIVLSNEVPFYHVPDYGGLNQLIDLLVDCPGLETLVLEHCLPSQLTQISPGQTIHLSRLSRLGLVGPSSRITNMLKMFKLPSSTRLFLHCVSENPSPFTESDRPLPPVVAAHFRGPSPIEFKSLGVTISHRSRLLRVAASTAPLSQRSRQSKDFEYDVDGNAEFVLSFGGLSKLGNWTDLFEGVCEILPILNLDFLSISTFDIRDSVNWVEVFKHCTEVSTMQAIGPGTRDLVRALTTPSAPNTKPNGEGKKKRRSTRGRSTAAPLQAPIFPKLTFLSLKSLDFAKYEHPSGVLFDAVEKGLQQRKAASKAPSMMLRIDDCVIHASRAKALQKLVREFHWDGKQGRRIFVGFDDSDSESESESD